LDKSLAGKRVLVTGGAGFIGSHIVDSLLARGCRVRVIDNLITGTKQNLCHCLDKIEFIQDDIRNAQALDKALEGIDLISHQAALRSVPKSVSNPLEYHQVNVTASLDLYLKAKDKGIERIVYASSSSVYGERENFPEKESDPVYPYSPYAATKLHAEQYGYIFTHMYGLDVVSLRYFNVYGPRQSLEDEYSVVIPKFTISLLNAKSVPIYDDGEQERDFTYIDDIVDANIKAFTQEGIGGQTFNIANGKPHSVNYLFKKLQELTGNYQVAEYLQPRPGDVRKTHALSSKAKELLGWEPKICFEEGLRRTVEWFRAKER
jgi:nucleoside-diphosphate-sugar epimerase